MVLLIREATQEDLEEVRSLFREYEAGTGVDLCFQGFAGELANLPGVYKRPQGFIFVAEVNQARAGCIALKPLGESVCEMKRLFVRPEFQGLGLGRKLAEACLQEARNIGYQTMRLDTLQQMQPAISLYRSLGFENCPAYYNNPLEGVVYMEHDL